MIDNSSADNIEQIVQLEQLQVKPMVHVTKFSKNKEKPTGKLCINNHPQGQSYKKKRENKDEAVKVTDVKQRYLEKVSG